MIEHNARFIALLAGAGDQTVPAYQIQEDIFEVITVVPQERTPDRNPERATRHLCVSMRV